MNRCRFWVLRALSAAGAFLLLFHASLLPAQILVLAPHPDDDVITASGVLSRALQNSQSVKVVFMTNGDYYGGSSLGYQRQGEAVTAEGILSVPESDLIFLGYPDAGLQAIYQSYTTSGSVYVSSNNLSATYGNRGLGAADYHTYRFGAPASYNRPNILQDLGDILTTYRPAQIFVTSEFDQHTDHSTTYLLLKMALSAIHSSAPGYAPEIHKTIVHWQHISNPAWPNAMDPTAFVVEPPDLESTTSLLWDSRESLDVPLALQSTSTSANPKYQAINAHASQGGAGGFLSQFIHHDEIFWVEPAFGSANPPIVNAGLDQVIHDGQTVALDGSQSVDPDGNGLSYQWTQTAGTSVTLHGATSATPTFTAPSSHSQGDVLAFQLVVANSSYTSVPDAVSVIPRNAQTITFANPGSGSFGATLTLAASASSGLPVTFSTSTPLVASISGSQVTFLATGTCTLSADQAGDSTWAPAATVSRSFQVNAVVPGAPTIGAATGGVNQATISFSPPGSNGGAALTGYTAVSSPGGFTGTGTASPIIVGGLANGTSYTFTVTAANGVGSGLPSAASNPVIPAPVAPGAPTQVTATAGDGQATVAFTAPAYTGGAAITGYTVQVNGGALQVAGAASPIAVTGLGNHAAYTFTVTASNVAGTGAASTVSNTVIPSPGGSLLVLEDSSPAAAEAGIVAHLLAAGGAGNNLTVAAATALPAGLAGYTQIWDVRSGDATPLSAAEQSAYLAFLQAGGQLCLVGGTTGSGARDTSLLQLIAAAGGGALTLATPGSLQQVQAPFTGPVTLGSIPSGATGAVAFGHGAAVTRDGSTPLPVASNLAWAPGTLDLAPAGGLLAVFSANVLLIGANSDCQALVANLMSYQTRISTASPAATGLDLPPAGSYKAGATLTFTTHFSAPVTVSGIPALPLAIGSQAAAATYASGSGTADLVFSYTVQPGDTGALTPASALLLVDSGSGTLQDAAGFPARVNLPAAGAASGILLDTTAPAAPAVTGISGLTLAGTAEAGCTVDIYLDSLLLGQAAVDGDGNWTFTAQPGQRGILTVVAVDLAGNASGASAGAALDTTVPSCNPVSATVATDSAGNPIALQITQAAATSVAVADPPAHGSATADGTAITYTPAPGYTGPDQFTYTASNACGTSAPAAVSLKVQSTVPPALRLTMLGDGSVTSDPLLAVEGSVSAVNGHQSLTLNGVLLVVRADGQFSSPVRLALGPNLMTLVETDQAGLSTTVSRTVTLDAGAPTLAFDQPADGSVVTDPHLRASGTVTLAPGADGSDPLSTVGCSLDGGPSLAATLAGLSFSLDLTLASGAHVLEFAATTTSGRTAHAARTVTLASELNGAITDPGADAIVTASSCVIRGTAGSTSPPVSVSVAAGTQAYAPAVVDGAFQQLVTLDAGQAVAVTVTITDAQNRSLTLVRNLVQAADTLPVLFTYADSLRALEIANGLATATADDLAKYDLAPRKDGAAAPDGAITLEDAALVLWLASGRTL